MADNANTSSSLNEEKELEDGEIDDLEDGEINEDVSTQPKYFSQLGNQQTTSSIARRQSFNGLDKSRNVPRSNAPRSQTRNANQKTFAPKRVYQPKCSYSYGESFNNNYNNNASQINSRFYNGQWSGGQNMNFYKSRSQQQLVGTTLPLMRLNYQTAPTYYDSQINGQLFLNNSDAVANLSSDRVDSDDFEYLLNQYKQIQEQLDQLEPSTQRQDSFVDDLIDDTFVDIPLDNVNLDPEKENAVLGNVDDNIEAIESAYTPGELSSAAYTPGEFSPFKITPPTKKVRTLSELNRLDLLDKGVDVTSSDKHNTEKDNIISESVEEVSEKRHLPKTKTRRGRNRKRRKAQMTKDGNRSSSDVYEKLGVAVQKNSSRVAKNEREEKSILRRKERLKAWRRQQALAKKPDSLETTAVNQDDYNSRPMEVDSDSGKDTVLGVEQSKPQLPIAEAPPSIDAPPVPLMHVTPYGSYPDQWINASLYPEISTAEKQGNQGETCNNVSTQHTPILPGNQTHVSAISSGYGDDADDDDSVQALREQLLKSMVTKRAAKGVVTHTDNSPIHQPAVESRSASPVQVTRSSSPALTSGKPTARSTPKVGFQANIPPPKHDPVVIPLGEDSDDSIESEDDGQVMGSIFGGLDSLIREARERASKPKSPEVTEIDSPDPTTPEALSVLSEEKRSEYKRLKQELAKREERLKTSRTKNQQLNKSSNSDVDKDLEGKREELEGKVRNLDAKLKEHRRLVSQDKKLLENTKNQLEDSSKALEEHENRVSLLRQQLERAERLKVVQTNLVNKLQVQNNRLKQRIMKRQQAASELEESLLRSRALLAARGSRTRTTILPKKQASTEDPMKKDENKLMNLFVPLEDVKKRIDQLSQVLQQSISHEDDQENGRAKNASMTDNSTKSVETLAKEKLDKEKLRLRKLEEELSKRLRATNSRQVGKLKDIQDKGACSDSELLVKKAIPARTSIPPVTGKTDNLNDSATDSVDGGTGPTLEILKRSNELENTERESKGPTFTPTLTTVITQELYSSAKCIWLDYENTLLPQQLEALSGCTFNIRETESNCVADDGETKDELLVPGPYRSPLLHFRSYRFSPYFRLKKGLSLSSLTYSHLIDPLVTFCSFELHGICNDSDCHRQHTNDITPRPDDILIDLAAYFPASGSDGEKMEKTLRTYVTSFTKQYRGKVSESELRVLFVNQLKKKWGTSGVCNVITKRRSWRPSSYRRKQLVEASDDDIESIKTTAATFSWKAWKKLIQKETNPRISEEFQEVRYFSENYNSITSLEEATQGNPSDEALWLRLADVRLASKQNMVMDDNQNSDNDNIDNALNTLAQALELNRHSEKLWLRYLELYRCRGTVDDLYEVCEEAVNFSSAYNIWYTYLDLVTNYERKVDVCLRMIQFVMSSDFDSDVKSHRLLELFFYLVQLDENAGHAELALDRFRLALIKQSDSVVWCDTLVSAVEYLNCKDLGILWLSYIHLLEFSCLPQDFFDPVSTLPSRIVCKDDVTFPWKPGNGVNYGTAKLLSLFHRALKSCAAITTSRDKISPSVALYKNLFAFERACRKPESAIRSCQRLLKASPKVMDIWLCLAALEELRGDRDTVIGVYKAALEKCNCHARIAYSAAKYSAQKRKLDECEEALTSCVTQKFLLNASVQGLKTRARSYKKNVAKPEPLLLYKKLLQQILPVGRQVPPMKPNVDPAALGDEQIYLWLCYCVFLEWFSSDTASERHQCTREAYETAIQATQDRNDVKLLWKEYLYYEIRALQEKLCNAEEINELFHRCLVTVPTVNTLPYTAVKTWSDYTFHNQVMALYRACVGGSFSPDFYDKYLDLYPDNVALAIQAAQDAHESNDISKTRKILSMALLKAPYNLNLWKIAIAVELKERDIKQARQLYQQATEIFPLSAAMWNDYSVFELSHASGERDDSLATIIRKTREHGVKVGDFPGKLP